jgi:hypothetical protein
LTFMNAMIHLGDDDRKLKLSNSSQGNFLASPP